MNEIIHQIKKIDTSTRHLIDSTNDLLSTEENHVKEVFQSLDEQYSRETREEAKASYDEIIKSANEEISAIQKEWNAKIKHLDDTYLNRKDELVEKTFRKLLEKSS